MFAATVSHEPPTAASFVSAASVVLLHFEHSGEYLLLMLLPFLYYLPAGVLTPAVSAASLSVFVVHPAASTSSIASAGTVSKFLIFLFSLR